jgi:hypothetical protein
MTGPLIGPRLNGPRLSGPRLSGPRLNGKAPPAVALGALLLLGLAQTACSPTVTVDVKPITIYAKLDADVRLRLDQEVKDLIQKNPNLF